MPAPAPKKWNTVAIVGVGLLGGSIGLAVRRRGLARRVLGIGRDRGRLARAVELGAIDRAAESLEEGVREGELILVCTPVEQVALQVALVARHAPAGALITDVGSTKEGLIAAVDAARNLEARLGREVHFLGSHPLAGSEKAGVEHARVDLFEGRMVVLTPTADSRREDAATLTRFWQSLGAEVREMSPADHDAALAFTSHLPHAVASLLAAATPPEHLPLTATGWRHTTRIAAGDVELWRQIFASNRPHTLRALDEFGTLLERFRSALGAEDYAALAALLSQGKRVRDAVGN